MIEQYKIIDHYLSRDEWTYWWDYVQYVATYKAGEKDHEFADEVGMVHELDINNLNTFPKNIYGSKLHRAYINCYAPRELAYFHEDSEDPDAYTMLYYPCPEYDIDEGGATELILDNKIVGIMSKPNRLLTFKSNVTHRATPFNSFQRYTVALKYTTGV